MHVTLEAHCRTRALQNDGGQYAIAAAIFELVNLITSEIDKVNAADKAAKAENEQLKKDLDALMEKGKPNFGSD